MRSKLFLEPTNPTVGANFVREAARARARSLLNGTPRLCFVIEYTAFSRYSSTIGCRTDCIHVAARGTVANLQCKLSKLYNVNSQNRSRRFVHTWLVRKSLFLGRCIRMRGYGSRILADPIIRVAHINVDNVVITVCQLNIVLIRDHEKEVCTCGIWKVFVF